METTRVRRLVESARMLHGLPPTGCDRLRRHVRSAAPVSIMAWIASPRPTDREIRAVIRPPGSTDYRASRVLAIGHGYCVAKAGLLTALAQAADIPARVGFADVRNHLASARLLAALGTDVFAWHCVTELFLHERWTRVSPTFDPETCRRAGVPVLRFDGRNDALLQAFGGGGHMRYERWHGAFHDVPARFLAAEMPRLYPFVARGGLDRFKASS